MNELQRSVVVALIQNNLDNCFTTRPDGDQQDGVMRREYRYLDILASRRMAFSRRAIYQNMGWKSDTSGRAQQLEIEPFADRILEKCAAFIRKEKGKPNRILAMRDESEDRSHGYCFDGLRFSFWKMPSLKAGQLGPESVVFEWIDEAVCGNTCPVFMNRNCRSNNRLFDPVLPTPVEKYRDLQDQLRKERNWPNLTVLKVHQMEPADRSGEKLVIKCCKESFSNFDCTNYPLPYLLRPDGTLVLDENKKRVDPRDLSRQAKKKLQSGGEATFRSLLGISESFDLHPQDWKLGTNLGLSICIIQVDEMNVPKGILLSWRASQDTSLKVGFNELHVGASSQIKLEYHLLKAPSSSAMKDKLELSAESLPCSPIDLKKAIYKECFWEAGLQQAEIENYYFLGAGWLIDLLHPELMFAVTTQKDIMGNVPEVKDLAHGDEFRPGGKGKLKIEISDTYWKDVARHLLGFPLGLSRDTIPVQWSPQGATALIEAHRCGLFWKNGETQLRNAVQDVIESEIADFVPEQFRFLQKEDH